MLNIINLYTYDHMYISDHSVRDESLDLEAYER